MVPKYTASCDDQLAECWGVGIERRSSARLAATLFKHTALMRRRKSMRFSTNASVKALDGARRRRGILAVGETAPVRSG
jgi:hypothetical protein